MVRDKEKRNEYQKKYQLDRYHKRRQFALDYLGGRCVQCYRQVDLEIDHIHPSEKSFALAKLWSIAENKIIEELDKCQLLCKACHKIKTIQQHYKAVNHGEGITGKKSCYCSLCGPLKASYRKKFKR